MQRERVENKNREYTVRVMRSDEGLGSLSSLYNEGQSAQRNIDSEGWSG